MKFKKLKYGITIFLAFTFCMVLQSFKSSVSADTPGFSVTPILNENQIKPGLGYFDLLLSPKQNQQLKFSIYNNGDTEIKIETTFGTSFTGDAGNVLYTPEKYKNDLNLKINIKDYVKVPKSVTIPAHSKSIVTAEVTMPTEKFDGVIAGGFNFNEKDSAEKVDKSKASNSSASITNRYSYVIGLVMQNNKDKVQPSLDLKNVEASQRNNRNIFSVNLQNTASTFLLDMNVDAEVTSLKDKKVQYGFNSSSLEMAPNSSFNLAIPVSIQGVLKEEQKSKPLMPGRYQLKMTVYGGKSENGKYQKLVDGQMTKYDYKWNFDKSFTVTGKESKKLNAKDVTVEDTREGSLLLYILIISIFVLILIIILLLVKTRSKKSR